MILLLKKQEIGLQNPMAGIQLKKG
uniref:Uncharacterized protein n=1 Tax=Arundo donax TaxID=35708 RepID=A0A0A9TJS2_ARUDO